MKKMLSILFVILLLISTVLLYGCGAKTGNQQGSNKKSAAGTLGKEPLLIRDGYKYGYTNQNGKIVISSQYDEASSFVEGLAAVGIRHKKGYIDYNGSFVIGLSYDYAGDFSEGYAVVGQGHKYGFIDKKGKIIGALSYEILKDFSGGLAAFYKDGKWGYINTDDKIIVEAVYDSAGYFKENVAAVAQNGKQFFIDKNGNTVLNTNSEYLFDFSENLAGFMKNNKYGFMDNKGKVVIGPQFDYVNAFSEGLAGFYLNGKWGYINKKGEIIISAQYEGVGDFKNGRAAVLQDKKWGYINTSGKLMLPLNYDYAESFYKDLAAVEVHGEYALINPTGKIIWQETTAVDIKGAQGVPGRLVKHRLDSEKYDFNIAYPQVEGMKNKALADRINTMLREYGNASYKGKVDEKFIQGYELTLNKNGIMSVLFHSSVYKKEAAREQNTDWAVVFNVEDGMIYNLSELFRADSKYAEKLTELVENGIKLEKIPLINEYQGVRAGQEFYLTEKELVLYHQVYEYTPYAYGTLEFYIPYSEINGYIDENSPIKRIMD